MLVCRSKPNTNAVEQSGMGWLLNPGCCFPLTITGVGQETAQAIKVILEMSVTTPRPSMTCLTAILAGTDARIKELDEEIAAGRTEFEEYGGDNAAAANLLSIAYRQARSDPVRLLRAHDDLQNTTLWKVSNVNDVLTCPECRVLLAGSYSYSEMPRLPVHFGCRCQAIIDTGRL